MIEILFLPCCWRRRSTGERAQQGGHGEAQKGICNRRLKPKGPEKKNRKQ